MERIFFNGRIYCMDEKNRIVEAVLTDGERIRLTGSNEEVLKHSSSGAVLVDLKGKTVIPGFIDSHMHLMIYGKRLNEVNLAGSRSIAEVIERGREFLKRNSVGKGQWLLGAGWNDGLFSEKRMIDRHDMDKISKDIPIVFTRACHHMDVCNTKALEAAGITRDFKIENGEIDVVSGELTGILRENAVRYMRNCTPRPGRGEKKAYIAGGMEKLSSFGITGVHTDDISDNAYEIMDIYKELETEGRITVRAYQQCRFSDPEGLLSFIKAGNGCGSGSDNYKIGSLKLLLDGSLGARTAAMNSPYEDDPGNCGILNMSEELLTAMVRTAHANEMPVAIHAIGDKTIDVALNTIEKVQKENYRRDVRHGIIHCQITSKRSLDKFAENHISAHIQPIFIASDSKIVESRVGRERARYSYNWKTLMDKGVVVTFGTDCPIETPNPFENIFCAVNRCDLDGEPAGGWLPEEKLTVYESVRAYTYNSAYGAYEEKDKGTIEVGKFADMAVLSQDIFEIDTMKIKDTECLMTIKGGEIVYKKVDI